MSACRLWPSSGWRGVLIELAKNRHTEAIVTFPREFWHGRTWASLSFVRDSLFLKVNKHMS